MTSKNENLEEEFGCYATVVSIKDIQRKQGGMMGSEITNATKGISAGIDAVRKLTELALKTQNIELQEGIVEVKEQLLAAKEALLNGREETVTLKEENRELKERIAELEKQSEEKLVLKGVGGYYTEDGDGPFCTRCYDAEKKKIRMSKLGPINRCGQCNNQVM